MPGKVRDRTWVGICLAVLAPFMLAIQQQNEVDNDLWGVYQEDVQLCLKYPSNYS